MPDSSIRSFNRKYFNGEVFQGYVDRVPNLKRNMLINSGAIRQRQDLAAVMRDQTGGNYISTAMSGLITNSTPNNYDGVSDMPSNDMTTFKHSRIVVGRMNSWNELDFSFDLTGGQDFLESVAEQVAEYWATVDQHTILAILDGVFSMASGEGAKFVTAHTNDICNKTNSNGDKGLMDGATVNVTMQKACGDNKSAFALAIMHSMVATNLENLKILVYAKYSDANGIQRDVSLATINGRLVLIDDDMPATETEFTAGVYEVELGGTWTATDKITVDGTEVTTGSTSAATIAGTVVTAMASNAKYTVTNDGKKLIFTEKTGKVGSGAPVVTTDSSAGTLTASTVTAPDVATVYTTYLLGNGMIEYTDCGARIPYEVDRDPKSKGGQDALFSRQRKCFAPWGISFTQAYMSRLSPTDAELRDGRNWEIVHSADNENTEYLDH